MNLQESYSETLRFFSLEIELDEEKIKEKIFPKNKIFSQNFDRILSMESYVKIKEINPHL